MEPQSRARPLPAGKVESLRSLNQRDCTLCRPLVSADLTADINICHRQMPAVRPAIENEGMFLI